MKTSRKAAKDYTELVGRVSDIAQLQLAEVVASLDWDTDDVEALMANRNYVIAKFFQLSEKYGTAASSIAADYFEANTAAAGRKAAARSARLAEVADEDTIVKGVHWAAGSLFNKDGVPDVESFTSNCNGILGRFVVSAANNTIFQSGKHNNVSVAYCRIIGDDNPCEMCEDLASRGFVWTADELIEPHDHCKCTLVPGFGEKPELV